jgi:hypothetical protein
VFCYQAVDGQWIFLDPLCVRILLAHYGSYEACPSIITAPVLDLETVEQVRGWGLGGLEAWVWVGCIQCSQMSSEGPSGRVGELVQCTSRSRRRRW